jgi:tetratricopeptide (TPR) repeat protein
MPWLAALVLALSAAHGSPASAQPSPVRVLDAYQQLYAGDIDASHQRFAALRGDGRTLPAWFGQLFTELALVEHDDTREAAFERELDAFIGEAESRYSRSRNDAEALFYLAQVHLLRGTYRISHDKGMLAAARDAARAKGYAEDYIRIHPEHGDAYLTLGIYNYYAGIAPTFVKVLRVLLFLPGGDRTAGLAQIEKAAREGSLFAPVAQGLLGVIYGSIEGRLRESLTIGERLVGRYPGNALVRLWLAQVYTHPTVEAYDRAEAQYRAVLQTSASAATRHVSERHRALQGLAALRRTQWRLDEAVQLLTPVIDQHVRKPAWIHPTFLLQRASYRMLLNDPGAVDDARRVAADAELRKWRSDARELAREIEAWRRRPAEAALYAQLITGNRFVAEDRWNEARSFYDRLATSHPGDWQIRFRLAALEFARGDYPRATPGLEAVVATRDRIPDWLRANALLTLAWTRDIAGRRDEALALYRRVVDDYEDESAAGPARIGLLTPYRGPVAR